MIAMGIKHARRVEAALDRARLDHPELDDFFAPDRHERFFVKNLERVQGDERDAIILTVGYGKDAAGKLLYRFGPLLSEGGERRLNVAITRARQRMDVVSSFSHHDMEPGRSKAKGVELLRAYLEYAASGGTRLDGSVVTTVPLNDFEQSVHDALVEEWPDPGSAARHLAVSNRSGRHASGAAGKVRARHRVRRRVVPRFADGA